MRLLINSVVCDDKKCICLEQCGLILLILFDEGIFQTDMDQAGLDNTSKFETE